MFGLMGGTNMRGLNQFISDIRECKDKQSETKRVQTELAKIREKFTTDKGLNAYQRKKYVWKLLYIHILGYQVDFGYLEASSLINAAKYDEKYTGYIACSLLVSEDNEDIWKSIVYSVEADLRSKNQANQSMALSMIASIVPNALLTALTDQIVEMAMSPRTTISVRKKAVMCLSRMIKKDPNKFDVKKFIPPLSEMFELKNCGFLSFLNGAASLLLTMMNQTNPDSMKQILPKVVRIIHKLSINKDAPVNYLYYTVPNPWLQMKLYKSLQIWSPPSQKGVMDLLEQILTKVIKKTDASESINKSNIEYGLLFEVINVIIHYDTQVDQKLIKNVSKILIVFISSTRANIRYLGLEAMCRLAVKHNIAEHQDKILVNLDDNDISIRKRALDLLYLICNSQNSSLIVGQLLGYLQNRIDHHIRDDLILKIAILAQKFAQNLIWYVDVVVKLIQNAQVQNDIWYRIIQIITGFGQPNHQLQNYAALKLFATINLPHVTDTLICVGSYVISEFSECLVRIGKQPQKIFEAISKHFTTASNKSKAMMVNALAKLAIKYQTVRAEVQMLCNMCTEHWDPNVQQRGVEFIALFAQDQAIQKKVVSENPAFTQQQQQANPLLKKFAKNTRRGKQLQIGKSSTTKQTSTITQPSLNQTSSTFQTISNPNSISHPLANHSFYRNAIDKLSPNLVNLLDTPGKWDLKPYWKQSFVKATPFDGCQIKQKVDQGCLKIILLINVTTTEMQFKIFRNKGFQMTNSPIKYGPDCQQIMLTMTPNGDKIQPPAVGLAWKDTTGVIQKKQVQLPVTISKFLVPVQLTADKFNTFYKDYSMANPKFYKIDSFLKVPEGVKSVDYLRKVGAFLSSICNVACTASPSAANLKLIFGSAIFTLKQDGKPVNYPLLIEIQCYEGDKGGALRVSLRGGNGNSLVSLYQLIIAFF